MNVKSLLQNILFSVTRLVARDEHGNESIGTAFVFTVQRGQSTYYPYIVTNRHVISGSKEFTISFNTGSYDQVELGKVASMTFQIMESQWSFHKDPSVDLAAFPIGYMISEFQKRGHLIFFRTLSPDMIPTDENLKTIDAVEDVLLIGYPNGLFDPVHWLPIVRKGISATPITVDFAGNPEFLIDASIFPGSSGSPVFLYKPTLSAQRSDESTRADLLLFLGVVSKVFTRRENTTIEAIHVPGIYSVQMIDIGVVVKAKCIQELLEDAPIGKGLVMPN
jgi:hypothetical protein